MADGEWWKEISIRIIDNDVAELTKTFSVFLKNPRGGGKQILIVFNFLIVVILSGFYNYGSLILLFFY